MDPAYRGPPEVGRVRFVRSNYGPEHADKEAGLVICRHVLEHVASPLDFLRSVRPMV